MKYPKDPDLTGEQNAAIDKEVAELMSMGVPEWQARETAAINLGIVEGDALALKEPDLADEQNAKEGNR